MITQATHTFNEVDLARLAAYIDGEGNIFIKPYGKARKSGGYYLQLNIVNTDPRLMIWLKKTFGANWRLRKQKKAKPHHKDSYLWIAIGSKAAELLRACYPYLVIKKEQADVALAFQATLKGTGVKKISNEIKELRKLMAQEISDLKWKVWEPIESGDLLSSNLTM